MEIAYWCVVAAALLPYLTVLPAKATGRYDNAAPRDWAEKQSGFRRRAVAAHLNGFEAFPLFAAAVIAADVQGMPQDAIDTLAVAWVVLRIGYVGCYFAGLATLRSIVWIAALAMALAILTMPAWLM
ncbi:MAPEG family protein [Rhodospirillum centenum]|uniref:Membrane protein, putative n=1 Tax=Rhodospirillum centenum (strain ATCC 51521 / SW) TaxID=414684 RepID=B6IV83_RHOCS|nr:MAPEG family protein [Rhodospirillum centenum]ACJ00207.1 membrane protein, putative [Rhodospirillum centenum SW]